METGDRSYSDGSYQVVLELEASNPGCAALLLIFAGTIGLIVSWFMYPWVIFGGMSVSTSLLFLLMIKNRSVAGPEQTRRPQQFLFSGIAWFLLLLLTARVAEESRPELMSQPWVILFAASLATFVGGLVMRARERRGRLVLSAGPDGPRLIVENTPSPIVFDGVVGTRERYRDARYVGPRQGHWSVTTSMIIENARDETLRVTSMFRAYDQDLAYSSAAPGFRRTPPAARGATKPTPSTALRSIVVQSTPRLRRRFPVLTTHSSVVALDLELAKLIKKSIDNRHG